MATVASPISNQSSNASNAVRARLRPDLVAIAQPTRKGVRWAVKDPVALNYFHFGEREWFILNQLNGVITADEIRNRFAAQFAPFELSEQELAIFLKRVHRDGLILVDQHGWGGQLFKISSKQIRQAAFGRVLSVLAIRFRGIDPERMLDFLSPIGSILFHPLTFVFVTCCALLAAVFGVIQADVITERLPGLSWFLQGENILWMFLTLGLVKILHEFGHGLACRRFGGECHEMGLMFLAFSPCLYVNVSDAWMLPNRWHRIVISAAGIYVELILATLCTLLWYFSHPGLFNSICLNVVLICSVSTVLLNGNPLLRYDGYYILSDLVDVPNLSARGQEAFWGPIQRWFLQPNPNSRSSNSSFGLAAYGLASFAYRMMVVATILWVFYGLLKANNLFVLAQALVVIVVTSLLLQPIMKLYQFLRIQRGISMLRWGRLLFAVAVLAAGMVALFRVPLPASVETPVIVESVRSSNIYALVDGKLTWIATEGTTVSEGEVVARFENKDLDLQVLQTERKLIEQQKLEQTLQDRLNSEPELGPRINSLNAEIKELETQLGLLMKDRERTVVTSPIDGVIAGIPNPAQTKNESFVLADWNPRPTDPANRGAFYPRGTQLATIESPDETRVVMYIGQEAIELVSIDDPVRVRLDQLPNQVLEGIVESIDEEQLGDVPPILIADPDFDVSSADGSRLEAMTTTYRVVVRIESELPELVPASGGRAKIKTTQTPLGKRFVRYLNRTLRFEL